MFSIETDHDGGVATGRTAYSEVVFRVSRGEECDRLVFDLATAEHVSRHVPLTDVRIVNRRGAALPSSK